MHLGIDASRAAAAQRTGTEGYAFHLIRALLPLAAERGHRVTLYFNQAPASTLFPDAERAVIPLPRLWTHIRLGWELRRSPPDLFFTPAHVIPISYFGPAAATVHDLGYHYFPAAHTRRQVAYLDWSTRHNARRSRRVLADSQATRDDLIRLYKVAADRICVVYPGIDPDLAPIADTAERATILARYGLHTPYLLYLGSLQPRKNLARLIRAYAASELTIPLVLAGRVGWRADAIHDAIAAQPAPIRERIRLPGFVAEADKAALLSGAVALLYPSLYEGFGFPILEAQRCATPVLTARNSSLPEVAGEAALFVEATNTEEMAAAIQRIAHDEALRTRLVEAGQANVGRFSWAQSARQALDALEEARA